MLEDAGYKDQGGVRVGPKGRLEFSAIYDQGNDPMAKSMTMIADDWAKIGVKLNLKGMERNTYLANAKALDFDIYGGRWGVMDEPADYIGLLFLSDTWQKGGINYSGINDPKLDTMIKEAQGSMDPKTMQEKIYKLQEYVAEQVPVVTLWVETYQPGRIQEVGRLEGVPQRSAQLRRPAIARRSVPGQVTVCLPGFDRAPIHS